MEVGGDDENIIRSTYLILVEKATFCNVCVTIKLAYTVLDLLHVFDNQDCSVIALMWGV